MERIKREMRESDLNPKPVLPTIQVRLSCGHTVEREIEPEKTGWLEAHGVCGLCRVDAQLESYRPRETVTDPRGGR
jgi:hypothetical protein